MRRAAAFLLAIALSIVPRTGSAQVSVTAPAAGAESSYRTTVVTWDPIPGASSYHLEIDDDPNFGSPEVDVTVSGTSYALSGERLNLRGQLSWAAYVRINGVRWNAWTFSPSYFKTGQHPALGVDSQNRVYLAFEDNDSRIGLRASSDWSSTRRLSLEDTFNTYGLNLVVDDTDVAHVSWMEQRPTELWVPYYTNSSTGWNLVRIPGTTAGGCSEGSIVAGGGQVDLFYDSCGQRIERWTTTNGVDFSRTEIPNNDIAISVSAARDGVGNLYVASERYTLPFDDRHSSLQTSANGWIPHGLGPGKFPALAVTPGSELHALRWSSDEDSNLGRKFLYSNSLREFQAWTELTTTSTAAFDQDILPLVVDASRDQLHAALPALDGIQLCTAAHTGLAVDTGTSWTCAPVGHGDATNPDLALAPDGTLHLAWRGGHGMGYANSLGSFLATNLTPQVSFGAPSSTASTVIVPAAISDPDDDDLGGHIHVGRLEPVTYRIEPGTSEPILNRTARLGNSGNNYIYDLGNRLQFRAAGTALWDWDLERNALPSLPATIDVREAYTEQLVGAFIIGTWDDTGVIVVQGDFVPYVKLTYSGTLPDSIDISSLPEGNAMVAIGVSDESTSGFAAQAFTKAAGQNELVLSELTP
jgi:hypothetical protein